MESGTSSKHFNRGLIKFCQSWIVIGSASLYLSITMGTEGPANGEQIRDVDESIVQTTSRQNAHTPVAVEWIRVQVNPSQRQAFVQKDAEIWTPALKRYPGFIDKAVWLNPKNKAEVIIVVRWTSREQWFSIPKADLKTLEQRFDQAFPFPYRIQEVREYQAL